MLFPSLSGTCGRADAIIQTETHVYCLEFKRDASVEEALAQVPRSGDGAPHSSGYLRPFAGDKREVLAVGVNFSSEERAVVDWRAEVV